MSQNEQSSPNWSPNRNPSPDIIIPNVQSITEQQSSNSDTDSEKTVIDGMKRNNLGMGIPNPIDMPSPAIVILTYNRPQMLKRTVDSLLALPGVASYTIYVSQDGDHIDTTKLITDRLHASPASESLSDRIGGENSALIYHLRHKQKHNSASLPSTAKLAYHYSYMFNQLFYELQHSHIIVLEDDMIFSTDFLELFAATAYLLNSDSTLFCVSSWNDYGQNFLDHDPNALFRTDYFPGLGWMLRKELWDEISGRFPSDHWDHFMRTDTVHLNRDCIVPQLSRNFNIGDKGSTMDVSWYNKYLKPMQFDESSMVAFQSLDISYLESINYERDIQTLISDASFIGYFPNDGQTIRNHIKNNPTQLSSLITYSAQNWDGLANIFGILTTPRTRHKHTIIIKQHGKTYIFANARLCPYLKNHPKSESIFIKRDSNFKALTGNTNESCFEVCKRNNLRCLDNHFEYVNTCEMLFAHFPCETGCQGGVIGDDVPNYVDGYKPHLFHMCLTTEHSSTCNARHKTTQRLCPCG